MFHTHVYHISIGYRYRWDDGRLLTRVLASRPGAQLAAQMWSVALTRRRCPRAPPRSRQVGIYCCTATVIATRLMIRIGVRRGISACVKAALSPNFGSRLGAESGLNLVFITSV